MFIQSILLFYISIYIYTIIDSLDFKKKPAVVAPKKKEDIWQHPFLVEAGIKKPVEECELEECESVPLCWQIKYNQKQTEFVTLKIEQ
jgi:hypothetical protein